MKSVGEFIRLYTTQNNRWLSPKFIVGESYGGTRAAGLCDYLQNEVGLYLDGVIIVSGLMNWQNIDFSPGNDIAYCLGLPGLCEHRMVLQEGRAGVSARDETQCAMRRSNSR